MKTETILDRISNAMSGIHDARDHIKIFQDDAATDIDPNMTPLEDAYREADDTYDELDSLWEDIESDQEEEIPSWLASADQLETDRMNDLWPLMVKMVNQYGFNEKLETIKKMVG